MPNISIIDRDYTTPGIGTSSSFAVLVPGFVSSSKWAEKAENDICELRTQEEFRTYVGKVPPLTATLRTFAKAVAFELDLDPEDEGYYEQDIPGYSKLITPKEFYADYPDQVYLPQLVQTLPEGKGKLILRIADEETSAGINYTYYQLTKVTEETYSQEAQYVVVLEGNEGTDANGTVEYHYGNQMAYELLGLGYPVFYKKLENIADLENEEYWEILLDKTNYPLRFVVNGLCNGTYVNTANNVISKFAATRGDCIALVDVKEAAYLGKTSTAEIVEGIKDAVNLLSEATSNTAIFAPTLCYNIPEDKDFNGNTKFPASFHYLACFANMLKSNYSEWYAAAGLTRGVSKYSITGTEVKLGEIAEKALEPRYQINGLTKAVNIIEKIRGNYFLYGNRTAHTLGIKDSETGDLVASHFLNIRQLCCTLKQELYQICKRLTFNPNSNILWVNFCNAIIPTLESMKGDQGIEDYELIQVATPKKATLKARVRIVPIEAVEDFDIEISLEDSLGETAVTISE